MGVLGEVKGVVRTAERGLQIAQHGIDRLELRQLDAARPAAGHDAFVFGTDELHAAETPQPIGDDLGRGGERLGREDCHRLAGERLAGEAGVLCVPLNGRLYGGEERHLVLRTAPALAPGVLPAEVGIVDLHPAVELAGVFSHAHDLHALVLHQPGGLVADAQVALEFESGNVVLCLGEQMHGQEPAGEPELGRLEDRAADGTALVAAGPALPVTPACSHEHRVGCVATVGTAESARPARSHQRRLALGLGTVAVEKRAHRKSVLELHLIHRHGPPHVSVSPFSALGRIIT